MRDVLDGWRSVRFLDVMEGKIGDSAEVVEKYKENDEDSQCLCPCDDAQWALLHPNWIYVKPPSGPPTIG